MEVAFLGANMNLVHDLHSVSHCPNGFLIKLFVIEASDLAAQLLLPSVSVNSDLAHVTN